ncbi:MAG: hypothetical protein ACE5GK_06615 [Nitrospiria bacterium]
MKTKKRRQCIGLIGLGVFLISGVCLSDAKARTGPSFAGETMSDHALFREIERQEASAPPLQVWNLSPPEAKGAKLNWATSEMVKAVSATIRGEDSGPIPGNAINIIRSAKGYGHVDDFRLALTLLSEEKEMSFAHLLADPITPAAFSIARNYSGSGLGVIVKYGFFSLTAYVMWMLSWGAIYLEHHPKEGEEQPYEYPLAA